MWQRDCFLATPPIRFSWLQTLPSPTWPRQWLAQGCPNGAAVLQALGNAQGNGGKRDRLSAQRANRSPGKTVGPLGRGGPHGLPFPRTLPWAWRFTGPSARRLPQLSPTVLECKRKHKRRWLVGSERGERRSERRLGNSRDTQPPSPPAPLPLCGRGELFVRADGERFELPVDFRPQRFSRPPP